MGKDHSEGKGFKGSFTLIDKKKQEEKIQSQYTEVRGITTSLKCVHRDLAWFKVTHLI